MMQRLHHLLYLLLFVSLIAFGSSSQPLDEGNDDDGNAGEFVFVYSKYLDRNTYVGIATVDQDANETGITPNSFNLGLAAPPGGSLSAFANDSILTVFNVRTGDVTSADGYGLFGYWIRK